MMVNSVYIIGPLLPSLYTSSPPPDSWIFLGLISNTSVSMHTINPFPLSLDSHPLLTITIISISTIAKWRIGGEQKPQNQFQSSFLLFSHWLDLTCVYAHLDVVTESFCTFFHSCFIFYTAHGLST